MRIKRKNWEIEFSCIEIFSVTLGVLSIIIALFTVMAAFIPVNQ